MSKTFKDARKRLQKIVDDKVRTLKEKKDKHHRVEQREVKKELKEYTFKQ